MFTLVDVLVFIFPILLIILVETTQKLPKPPKFNVYQLPKKFFWLKVCFIYFWLYFKQKELKKNFYNYEKCEKPFFSTEQATDSIYFNGSNLEGDYLILGFNRKRNRKIDCFACMQIESSKQGILQISKSSSLQNEDVESFASEEFIITPLETMKKWKISFNGKMKDIYNTESVVSIEAEWNSNLPYYNFDVNFDILSVAKSIAREVWNKTFFSILKELHQVYYEQYGNLTLKVIINNNIYNLKMDTLRSRTISKKRNWKHLHRYVNHFINMENGNHISIGVMSMPIMLSCLYTGFIYSADEKKNFPLQDCSLLLHQHGEKGIPPKDYAFSFIANKKKYFLQVLAKNESEFQLDSNSKSWILERFCVYEINGVKGWGGSNWLYR